MVQGKNRRQRHNQVITMKKSFLGVMALVVLLLTSCAGWDHYDTVPEKTERVLFVRPAAQFNRNAGGYYQREILQTGKRLHADGPVIGFDLNLSRQQFRLSMDVNMADKMNQTFNPVFNCNIKQGAGLDLVLNFLPYEAMTRHDSGGALTAHADNDLEVYEVPLQKVFDLYIAPYADMAARDILGDYTSQQVDIDHFGDEILKKTIETLEKVRIPRTVIDSAGVPHFDPTQTICILEVVSVNSVTVADYSMPEALKEIITKIQNKQNDYKALAEQRERLNVTRSERMLVVEQEIKKNRILNEMLARNPLLLKYRRQQELKEWVDGKIANTKVYLVPEWLKEMRFQ
jgi:hypothetical protein